MTLDEKLSFVHGIPDPEESGAAGYIPGVPRLGIPELRLTDGPIGIRVKKPATAMPAPIVLGSSFDDRLAHEFGSVIGKLLNPWYLHSSEVECYSLKDGQFKRVLGEDAHFYRLQVESFADAIRGEDKFPAAGIEDGLAALKVLRAIRLSVQKQEPVAVADVTGAI